MATDGAVTFRSRRGCIYDAVALGEVMLRLDPGAERVRNVAAFQVHKGGGEYNVAGARGCCFGLRRAIVTALVDNEVGHLIGGLMRRTGVDVSWRRRPLSGAPASRVLVPPLGVAVSPPTYDVSREFHREHIRFR